MFLNLTEQLAKINRIQCTLYILHVQVNCKNGLKSINFCFGIFGTPPCLPVSGAFSVEW